MNRNIEEIGAYEARVHLGRILDRVHGGASYVVTKRREAIAAIIPIDQWNQDEGAEGREIADLVAQIEARHAETSARLDKAVNELSEARAILQKWRAERREAAADAGE